MTSTQPTVEAWQEIVDAAERGAQIAGSDQRYVKLTKVTLQTVGRELARHLQPGEEAPLCIPADVAHDGRYDPGMVLLLAKRTVVAWVEGTLRIRVRSLSFAHDDISEVATVARDRGRLSPCRDAIIFVAGEERHEFVFPSKVARELLSTTVSGMLVGAITFTKESGAD